MSSLYDDKKSGHKHVAPVLILSLAVLLGGGGFVGYFALKDSRPVLNQETLCPEDGPHSRTVLLVDVSDPFTATQRAALENLLQDLQNPETSREIMTAEGVPGNARYVEPYGELVAYLLEAEEGAGQAALRICNPGNPDVISLGQQFTTGIRRMETRWRHFRDVIADTFSRVQPSAELPNSPLLEALGLIVQSEGSSMVLRSSGRDVPLRIILFSDMIQHSQSMSHFQELPDWSQPDVRSQFATLRPELLNIEVVVYYLRQEKYRNIQTTEHFNWWRAAIAGMNGELIYIGPVN